MIVKSTSPITRPATRRNSELLTTGIPYRTGVQSVRQCAATPLRKAVLFLFVCIASAAFAQNNSDRLKGDFPFNETLHITTGSAQNGTCPDVLTGTVTQSIVTNTGIWSLDGAGNLKIVDQGVLVQVPSTDASQVTPINGVCRGTYRSLDDDTVDFRYTCSTSPGSFFQVHTVGKITPHNILVAVDHRTDGSLEVTPFFVGKSIVACTYIAENTVIARTGKKEKEYMTSTALTPGFQHD